MVYRFSWLAGTVALAFALTGLNGLLRPTSSGTRWQYIVLAALVLGATITWTALSYRAHPTIVIGLNLVAIAIAIARIAAPETTNGLLPTSDTLSVLGDQLDRAFTLIRTGIEPVQPLPGIVIIVSVVFWITGTLLTWGLMRGHPYVALVPPLVLALQFATMDRGRTGWLRMAIFLAVVAGSIIAVTIDERDQAAGRMSRAEDWPTLRRRLAPSAVGLLGITLAVAVIGTSVLGRFVPYDGVLPWRAATGLSSGYYGGISYNPFIGIQQSLISQTSQPVFLAEISGEVPASEVYFQMVTMETFNGGQFFADKPIVVDLDTRPWEDGGHSFAGPTGRVTTAIQIERLRMDWLPQTYVADGFGSDEDTLRSVRVRQADGSLRLDGDISYEGQAYTVESRVPLPDIAVLATDQDGDLSPAFEYAADQQQTVPDPVVATSRPEPPDVEVYLDLPEDLDPGIEAEAQRQTANLATNYEIGLALESWFHSDAFAYSANIDPGHGATDLAAWLLEPDSPNFHVGYCENFATAMAVMARTLGVPSRVVLGFTPGEPHPDQDGVWIVRDRNAHAWVELWMPTQGWVRFDPTPRRDAINPSTYGLAEAELGFPITEYLDVPNPEPIAAPGAPLLPPEFGEQFPIFSGGGEAETGGGISVPGWVKAAVPIALLLLLLLGTVPSIKWWKRRRRMKRLENGDITAAWEDIVARLTDLGEKPSPAATPRQLAASVDSAMVPLAIVYGRSVYGPDGAVEESHVATAVNSLEETRERLSTTHSFGRRLVAAYRPATIIPERASRMARTVWIRRNGNGSNGDRNGG